VRDSAALTRRVSERTRESLAYASGSDITHGHLVEDRPTSSEYSAERLSSIRGEATMADDNRAQQATLGCGTLLLIGLVVLFFSRPGMRDIEQEIGKLRGEVQELRKAVDEQTKLLQAMKGKE
jgi:hypothetical protein